MLMRLFGSQTLGGYREIVNQNLTHLIGQNLEGERPCFCELCFGKSILLL